MTRRTLLVEKREVGDFHHSIFLFLTSFLEYGHADVNITKVNENVDRLFAGLGDAIPVFMSHFDKLISLPTVSELDLCYWYSH